MAAIAATTQRIRVGTAGVMLPHYASLKVAEQFRVLEAIAPGRIDLGVGRAPGSGRAHRLRAEPASQPGGRPLPAAGAWKCWAGSATGCRRTTPSAAIIAQPAVRDAAARCGSWASATTARRSRPISACPTASRISSPTAAASEQAIAVYREGFRPQPGMPGGSPPRTPRSASSPGGGHRGRGERLFRSRELWRLSRDRGRLPAAAERRGGRGLSLLRRRNSRHLERHARAARWSARRNR